MTCDYCDQPAKWIETFASDDTGDALCTRCAKSQLSDWRYNVRKIGKRDLALRGLAATTEALISNTSAMINSAK